MKSIYLLLIIVLFSVKLSGIQLITGNLAGRIIDQQNQQPLEQVSIAIDDTIRGISDEDGRYLIRDIKIGSHQLDFGRLGYNTQTKLNIFIKPAQTEVINVELQVKQIMIEGSQVTEKVFFSEIPDAPVSSKSLDIAEIKSQPSGVYDIQRSIQAIPAIVAGSDAENEIIVRGGNYGENLFVLDNIELLNPNHFGFPGTGGGPISLLTPEFVKELDFYAGAFPARYGNKASSVLDIKTRDGNVNRMQAKLDVGMAGYGADLEGPVSGGKGNYIFSYHRSFMSLLSESIGLSAVPNYQSIFAKQVYNFTPTMKLTLNQIWGDDWIDIIHDEEGDDFAYDEGEEDVYDRSGQLTLGATFKKVYKGSFSELTIFRNYHWWDVNVYDAGYKDDEHKTWTEQASEAHNKLKYAFHLPYTDWGNWETGAYISYDKADTDRFLDPDTVFVWNLETDEIIDTVMVNKISESNRVKENISPSTHGAYLQWDRYFGSFKINAGLRYDYLSTTDKSSIAPRLGMKYELTRNTSFSLGAGRQFQNPDYYTLILKENRELKPKYTDQIIGGIEHLFAEDVKCSIETYYKEYFDVPISISAVSADTLDWSYIRTNSGRGWAKGIEFFLQKKVKNNLWGTISYAYSIAQAEDPRNPGEEYDWDFDYRHVFTGIIGHKIQFMNYDWYQNNRSWMKYLGWLGIMPADETEISLKYRYLGGKPYTEKTYYPELKRWLVSENTKMNDKRFSDYQRLDLHIQHRWFGEKVNIISYLEVDNIFNTKNIWDYNYLEDGEIEEVYQWGRMIIGGVVIEF